MDRADPQVIATTTPDPSEVAALLALANRRRLQDRERLNREGKDVLRKAGKL